MIDLTPLDVRKKRGDFRKQLRGYEPEEVDSFLDLVAERLEELVKETLTLRERSERLQAQVSSQEGREKAVQEALVTAQELRDEIRGQAQREAEQIRDQAEQEARLVRREAESEAQQVLASAEARMEERRSAVEELERKRLRFLKAFRQLLQREMDTLEVEEGRTPLEDMTVELDLGGGRPEPGETLESPVAQGEDLGGEEEPTQGESDQDQPDPHAPVHDLAWDEEDEEGEREPDLWLSSAGLDEPQGSDDEDEADRQPGTEW